MSVSLFKSPHTVLLISDEALYIYAVGPRSVKLIETVSWDMPTFVDSVANILVKDCRRRPILFLNDTVEQHYRKERIPKVGVMDRANVLNRRLKVAFPSYPVRAALPLKEKVPKSKEGRPSFLYIFAALPRSENFSKAMEAAKKSYCAIAGVGLLPVEASDLVKKLSLKLTPRGHKKSVWSMMIGLHQSGGLRQIVTKNGELALTRMTPISGNTEDPHAWAKELHQEYKATMSYLSRFGYTEDDGLDVIAITNPQTGEALGDLLDEECKFYPLSVREAAKHAGVSVGYQEDQRFADPLHIAWAGRKTKLILPMGAKEIEEISKPRRMAMLISLLLLLGGGGQTYQLLETIKNIGGLEDGLQTEQLKQSQLDDVYKSEVAKKEALGFDIRLIQAATEIYGELEDQKIPALNLVQAVGRSLGRDLRIDKMRIERAKDSIFSKIEASVQDAKTVKGGASYALSFQMTYPSTTDIDRGNQEVSDLRDRLAALLPDHTVKVEKFLKDYEFVDELVVETGVTDLNDITQDFVASIRIERSGS